MLQLLLMMFAAMPPSAGVPDRVILRDPQQGPTPVTDLFVIPPKIPDCRTDEQIRHALQEKADGYLQSCDPPKSADQHRR